VISDELFNSYLKQLTILCVEDSKSTRLLYKNLFSALFKEVLLASDGKEALTFCHKDKVDMILTDYDMPHMNGIELSKEILKINKSQKIIIISAYNETDYFIELIKIGVNGFIQKPLNLKQIYEIFNEVCSDLNKENTLSNYIEINDEYRWDKKLNILYKMMKEVKLSSHEVVLLSLFLSNRGQKFTDQDIFNHIYYDNSDKEFSTDAIKSLIKRARKKLPKDFIITHKNIGYSFKLTLS